jgi:hypothetical protein
MRPIMTASELAVHQVDSFGRDYSKSDDGYGDMEVAANEGWTAISGWGRDGWDLGDWPYVVIYARDHELRQIVEGDSTVYAFDNVDDLHAAIDYLFIWYGLRREYDEWTVEGLTYDKRDALDNGELRVPERFRGPFSWKRLEREGSTT